MGLETGTTISSLVSTNPLAGDPVGQGDDHLRLIKSILKTQFPGAGATGFNTPLTATEAELNFVSGVSSSIQTQLNTLTSNVTAAQTTANNALAMIPVGTRVVFFQAAAPTGWTQVITHNNKMLRVVSGVGGGSGGIDSPILNDKVPSHIHTVTIGNQSVSHTHDFTSDPGGTHAHANSVPIAANVGTGAGGAINAGTITGSTSTIGNHTHTGTTSTASVTHNHSGTIAANTGADTWTPLYLDTIICSKN